MSGKIGALTKATLQAFDALPVGEFFFGNELKNYAVMIDGTLVDKYVDTFLRMLRRHRHGKYVLCDRNDSLYKKTA